MHRRFRSLAACAALLATTVANAAPESLPTFVTTEKASKPTMKADDEQFVRDYAKSVGQEFDHNMELPTCISRTHARTAGGFIDAFRDDDGYGVLLRVPVDPNDLQMRKLTLHRNDYPRVAYLELRNRIPQMEEKQGSWQAVLVLPPLKDASSPVGPDFEVVSASLGVQRFSQIQVSHLPGTQIRVSLGKVDKLLDASEQAWEFKANLQMIERQDEAALPRITIATAYPALQADLRTANAELSDIRRRDRAERCKVLPAECRDGECR